MKIITRGVIDWATLEVLEEESYEYSGPVALAKSSGSAPQPVDPYQQAAAQYGLSTGTASYNAALNRPNMVNPLGSTTWGVTGYSGGAPFSFGGNPSSSAPASSSSGATPQVSAIQFGHNPTPYITPAGGGQMPGTGPGGLTDPNAQNLFGELGAGAPLYTESTQLAPQFNSMLQQPIDTSQIPGMPGGPSLQQNVNSAENAVFGNEMGLVAPQEKMQSEQLDAQLANQGITPGSAAYDYAKQELGRQQGFENSQIANQAVTTGMGELPMFYGLGSTSLQNQITARNAPINEFEALQGATGGSPTAMTPDISGAFGQQYQGALAGYNANTATDNANTQAAASLLALLAFSDERLKTDIKRVGKTDAGLPVYTYRFRGDPKTQMGVMAQEVEKENPEAVFSFGGPDGPKMVNYGAIR